MKYFMVVAFGLVNIIKSKNQINLLCNVSIYGYFCLRFIFFPEMNKHVHLHLSKTNQFSETLSLIEKTGPSFNNKLNELKLPLELTSDLEKFYIPICYPIIRQIQDSTNPRVIGICGSQGSGKTTFTELLKTVLETGFGLNVVSFSIDDFYLTREERTHIGKTIHPLLITRGVPGTHDVSLAIQILRKLKRKSRKENVTIPRYNKSIDDRFPEAGWSIYTKIPDVILFEGWCVGATPQAEAELDNPVNDLEKEFDIDKKYRNYVNFTLSTNYKKWFTMIDTLIMLKVPSFEKVFEWRWLQEEKLRQYSFENGMDASKIMSQEEIKHFISHFERLTKHMLSEMPSRADIVITIDSDHRMNSMTMRP
jgi:D-glycerate 3-kinase